MSDNVIIAIMLVLMIPLTLWLRSFFEDHDEKMNKSQKNKKNDED